MALNIGKLFEELFPKLFGGKRVKGSGNKWYAKLDIEGNDLLCSLKATKNKSFSITKKDLDEAFEAVKGPGGIGGDYIPLLVVDFVEGDKPESTDKIVAVIDMQDLYQLLSEERKLFIESKSSAKHRQANLPYLFRPDH